MYFYLKLFLFIIVIFAIFLCIFFFTDIISKDSEGFKDKFNYRLGDVVEFEPVNKDDNMKFIYSILYRNSIAYEYYLKTKKLNDYETLYEIIKNRMKKTKNLAPENTLILHIRIGDVIDWEYPDPIDDILSGKKENEYSITYDYLDKKIKRLNENDDSIKDIILVGGYHTKGDHTRSEEYIRKIKKFLNKNNFNVKTRISNDINKADEDIIWMTNSDYFVKSGGRFSNLISKMVELNGGVVL